jgi:predicted ATPase/class 3 adenylate cyclase
VGSADTVLPSGTITFLLTDVAGSTPLWEKDEAAMTRAMARHNELLRRAVVQHQGAHPLEQGEGDSMVAVFARPLDAIGAALAAQLSLAADGWPDGMALTVRMALHTGEARPGADGRTYQGTAIIRCARLRALAHGGQVLVSSTTAALAADSLPPGVTLRELGVHALKGLRRPELVWQLTHASLPDEFPPLVGTEAIGSSLPLALTAFFGQQDVISDIAKRLRERRLVTLTGSGGCGKTRLANEVARRTEARHTGGVWWVELASATSTDDVTESLGMTTAVMVEPGRPLLDSVLDYLRRVPGESLFVLDNCENVAEAAATVVERVLQALPQARVLSTSREPLRVSGEYVIRVPSLDPTGTAVQLFIDRAEAADAGFELRAGDRALVEEVCARLDGIPLAIELAAARVRTMSLSRLASGLADAFRLLIGGPRTGPPRQQTMQACVSWSVDQLDPTERIILRRLAVFAGKFTLQAAVGICSSDDIGADAVLDAIDHLVDKSLLAFDPEADRYFLLEVVRQHGRTALRDAGEFEQARTRHATWFCRWVRELAPPGHRTDSAHEEIALMHADVAAALDHALDHDRPVGLETLASLCGYFNVAGRNNEATRRFVELSATAPSESMRLEWARAVSALALEALWTGVTETDALERARAIAADAGDQWAELLARSGLAVPPSFGGDLEPVLAVVADASRAGQADIELLGRLQLASMYNIFGQPTATLAVLDGVPARMRDLGWDAFSAVAESHCAVALASLGRPAEALALIGAVEPRTHTVDVLVAETYRMAGLLMADARLLDQARAALPKTDWIVARVIEGNLAYTEALVAGDASGAVLLLRDARQLTFAPATQITVDELLAPCLVATRDLEEARTVCARLDLLAESVHSGRAAAASALAQATIALATDDPHAFEKTVAAFGAAQASESQAQLIDAAELLVVVLAHQGRVIDAARVNVRCERARTRYGYRWRWPHVAALRATAEGAIDGLQRAQLERVDTEADAVGLVDAAARALNPSP